MKIRIELIDNFVDYDKKTIKAEDSKNFTREESEELYKELVKLMKKYLPKEKVDDNTKTSLRIIK